MVEFMTTITVIDDDAHITTIVNEMLSEAGFVVHSFNSSTEGFKFVFEHKPDVLILDIFMPDIDGYEFIRKIHNIHPSLKVITISGGCEPFDKESTLTISQKLGANMTLQKPFDYDELLNAVDKITGQSTVGESIIK